MSDDQRPTPPAVREERTTIDLFPECPKHPQANGYQFDRDGRPICSDCWNEHWAERRRLEEAGRALLAACTPERLEALEELLRIVERDIEVFHESCRLLAGLQAAVRRAGGDE